MQNSQPLPPEAELPPDATAETFATAPPSLTHQVGKGVAWLMLQTLGTKAANWLSTLLLAWLLDKPDFALIAMVNTVTAFTSVLGQMGQKEILIQRQAHFSRWANPAFWMALCSGTLGMVIMASLSPLIALVFHHDTRLIPLLLIAAMCAPIDALGVVPNAKLQSELRFRVIVTVGLCMAILSLSLQALLASPWVGVGAYAFILPRPLVSIITTVSYWRAAPVKIRRNPQFRRWKYMLSDSGTIFGLAVTASIIMQGDNLTVGLLCSETAMSVYYFSYNSSFQAIQMIVSNLQDALFPALSKIAADPVRQVNAYMRAARVSGMAGCTASLLQAMLAGPLIHLLFRSKWDAAIPVFRVLSVAMAINALCGPVISLYQAQGRFGFLLRYRMVSSTIFLICIITGAKLGEAFGVACGLFVLNIFNTPVIVSLAIRPGGKTFRDTITFIVVPLALALLSVAPAFGLVLLLHRFHLPPTFLNNLITVMGAGALAIPTCALLLAKWQPWAWHEIRNRLARFRHGR